MTDRDPDSKAIKDRMDEVRYAGRTEFSIEVMRVHAKVGKEGHWMCSTRWSTGRLDGYAAEGKTLKEALEKLAAKMARSIDATEI
jgi:hypothetical protein